MRAVKPQQTESFMFQSELQNSSKRRSISRLFGYASLTMLFAVGGASAQTVTATVATGSQPQAVAVNPVTNQIYVVNNGSASVTVIGGASNTASTIAVGVFPIAAAVNPVTNKIYGSTVAATA